MSRNKTPWVVATLTALTTSLLTMGGAAPASADGPPLSSPVASDLCGSSKDQAYLADDTDPSTEVSWLDSNGAYYVPGQWNSTNKASSLTMTVRIWGATGLTSYTYPPMTFGVESDASCVQALDTVSVSNMTCMSNGGTRATFTYMNTPDIGWPQTFVSLYAARTDNAQSASFNFTSEGVSVAEGATASVTGGDTLHIRTDKEFFLLPGTYEMWVRTTESGQRKLPNTFFVPACGDYKVPPGDPSGLGGQGGQTTGGAQPKGVLKQVAPTKMKVKAINRNVPRATTFKVVIDPKKGKTTTNKFTVRKNKSKPVVRTYKAPARTRFVLKARVTIEDANGRLVNKWKVLKRSTLKTR